jgi:hypothetical protein
MWWKRSALDIQGATVILRQDLISVLAEELEADCNPVVALDAILDYLEAKVAVPMFLTSKLTGAWAVCDPDDADALVVDINALRIQENQP